MRAARAARRLVASVSSSRTCPGVRSIQNGRAMGGRVDAGFGRWNGFQQGFIRGYQVNVEDDNRKGPLPFQKFEQRVASTYEDLWRDIDYRQNDVPGAIKLWEKEGNKFTRVELIITLHRLRSHKHPEKALELLRWIMATKPFPVIETDYAQLVTFACRSKDFKSAEAVMREIPDHFSHWPAFCALVEGFASANMHLKAEALMASQKCPVPQAYSSLILMYIRLGMIEKIPGVYNAMKADGLEPNTIAYALLLKYKDRIGQIEGLEKDAEAAMAKVDLHNVAEAKKPSVAGNMMHAYALLGKLDKVEQVWKSMSHQRGLPEGFFAIAIESLVLLGEVVSAEKVALFRPSQHVYSRLFQAEAKYYAKKGDMRKVEALLAKSEKLDRIPPSFSIYNSLVTGYLAKNDPATAASRMRLALKTVTHPESVPSYEAVMGVLPVFAQEKDLKSAEVLVSRYRGWRDARLYEELLKVYTSCGEAPSKTFLKRFCPKHLVYTKETKNALHKVKVFKPRKY